MDFLNCDAIWENAPHVAQDNFAEITKQSLNCYVCLYFSSTLIIGNFGCGYHRDKVKKTTKCKIVTMWWFSQMASQISLIDLFSLDWIIGIVTTCNSCCEFFNAHMFHVVFSMSFPVTTSAFQKPSGYSHSLLCVIWVFFLHLMPFLLMWGECNGCLVCWNIGVDVSHEWGMWGVHWFLASIGDIFRFLPSKLGTHRKTGISPISSKGCIQYNWGYTVC